MMKYIKIYEEFTHCFSQTTIKYPEVTPHTAEIIQQEHDEKKKEKQEREQQEENAIETVENFLPQNNEPKPTPHEALAPDKEWQEEVKTKEKAQKEAQKEEEEAAAHLALGFISPPITPSKLQC